MHIPVNGSQSAVPRELLVEEFAGHTWELGVRMRSLVQAALEPGGPGPRLTTIPHQQRLAVFALGGLEPLTMSQLADRLGVRASSATELVDRLVERGLVERQHDPRDRRNVTVGLTAQAQAVHREVIRAVKAAGTQLLANVDDRDLAVLVRLLHRVVTPTAGQAAT